MIICIDKVLYPMYNVIKLTFREEPSMALASMASCDQRIPQADYFSIFLDCFESMARNATENGASVSMSLFDIDLFGELNERLGAEAGDAILEQVSRSLRETVVGSGEVLRYGGDAFAVLFAGVEKEEAFLLAERARQAFRERRIVCVADKEVEFHLTLSAGVATIPDDGSACVDVVRKANEALYRAKVGGRNRVCLAREERMVTKTSHYTQGQLAGLSRLAKRMGVGEAVLLREALDDLLRKYNA